MGGIPRRFSGTVTGEIEFDVAYDFYAYTVCGLTGDTLSYGPLEYIASGDEPLCGSSMTTACPVSLGEGEIAYSPLRITGQGNFLYEQVGCHFLGGDWYSFIAPASGQVGIERGSSFGTLFNADSTAIDCWTQPSFTFAQLPYKIFSDLVPGNTYYIRTFIGLFAGGNPWPLYFGSSVALEAIPLPIQISSLDSLQADCSESIAWDEPIVEAPCGIATQTIQDSLLTIAAVCEQWWERRHTYIDSCGNVQSISQFALVLDTIAPQIICPTTDTLFTMSGLVGQPYGEEDLVYSDNCNELADYLIDPAPQDLLSAGVYELFYGVNDGCGNAATCATPLIVLNPVGLVESALESIALSQHARRLSISYPELLSGYRCELYDISAKQVASIVLQDEPASIDLGGLSTGTYVLTFSDYEQVVHSMQLLVE